MASEKQPEEKAAVASERLCADLVFLAERGIKASLRIAEELLALVSATPLSSPDPSVEIWKLSLKEEAPDAATQDASAQKPWGRQIFLAWIRGEREEANLRWVGDLDAIFETRGYVALYRHRSEQGLRRLTIHPVGNCATPPNPDYGPERSLAWAEPQIMYDGLRYLREVKQERALECEISYEITHHNPVHLSAAIHFLEIGDGPVQWEDRELAQAAAETARRMAFFPHPPAKLRAVGIAYGDHYAQTFGRMTLEHPIAFGHLLPSQSLREMTALDIIRAVEKTTGGIHVLLYKRLKGFPEAERLKLEAYCRDHTLLFQTTSQLLASWGWKEPS